MTIDGVLLANPNDWMGLWLHPATGPDVDVGWPEGFSVVVGPGLIGRVEDEYGHVVAESGQHVVLWGVLVRAAGAPRAPASPGRDGFKACEINGIRYSFAPHLR